MESLCKWCGVVHPHPKVVETTAGVEVMVPDGGTWRAFGPDRSEVEVRGRHFIAKWRLGGHEILDRHGNGIFVRLKAEGDVEVLGVCYFEETLKYDPYAWDDWGFWPEGEGNGQ